MLETPEKWWLEDAFPFGARPMFRGDFWLLVSGRVTHAKTEGDTHTHTHKNRVVLGDKKVG